MKEGRSKTGATWRVTRGEKGAEIERAKGEKKNDGGEPQVKIAV